jgi:transcriptional regulator with XRE-family HTH domain
MAATILYFPIMIEEDYSRYPNRIREIRKNRGKTLEWLANECDCTIATISDMERGRRPVRLDWLQLIGRAFNMPASEFLSERDNPTSLNVDERRLINLLRGGSEDQRRTVMVMAEAALNYHPATQLKQVS